MNSFISEIEQKAAALEVVIQDQPENQEDADMLTEIAARLITCSNAVRAKE